MHSILVGLLSLAGLTACSTTNQSRRVIASPVQAQPQVPTLSIQAGTTITLHVGEQVKLDGDTSLQLDAIIEDSRCPANAHCIWVGRVVVSGTFSTPDQTYPFTLGMLSGMDDAPRSIQLGSYELSLEAVEPYPEQADQLRSADYRVSFWIEPIHYEATNSLNRSAPPRPRSPRHYSHCS